jgi:hypothetical protein
MPSRASVPVLSLLSSRLATCCNRVLAVSLAQSDSFIAYMMGSAKRPFCLRKDKKDCIVQQYHYISKILTLAVAAAATVTVGNVQACMHPPT